VRLAASGLVQVSMNLTDYKATPLVRVFDAVRQEAQREGVAIAESEFVGLVPADALFEGAASYLQLKGFSSQQVLEERLKRV
jgi:glutamate formiminotransferase